MDAEACHSEWDLSMAELDRLEREALMQAEERRKSGAEACSRPAPNGERLTRRGPRQGAARGTTQSRFVRRETQDGDSDALTVHVREFRDGRIATKSPYNETLVAVLKSVPEHEWNSDERMWTFPEGRLDELLDALASAPQLSVKVNLQVSSAGVQRDRPKQFYQRANNDNMPEGSARGSTFIAPPTAVRGKTAAHQSSIYTITLYEVGSRIAAKASYNEGFKQACQSILQRSWDTTERAWTFPQLQLETALQAFSSIPNVTIQFDVKPPLELPAGFKGINHDGRSALEQELPSHNTTISEPDGNRGKADWMELPSKHMQTSSDSCPDLNSQPSSSQEGERAHGPTVCNVKLMPQSSGDIAALFSYYSPLVEKMRSIPGAEWNLKAKHWTFPVSSLAVAITTMNATRGVKVQRLEPLVLRAMQVSAARPDDSALYANMPVELEKRLLPFQREGIKFALKKGGRALFADEMGLGKTLQAISIAMCYREEWPVLVLVPSALRLQWAMAIHQWLHPAVLPGDITLVMPAATKLREGFAVVKSVAEEVSELEGLFCVLSYDAAHKLPANAEFKVVIADEAHYLKSPKARRTTASLTFLQKAKRAILLTGTPALNRPIELFTLLKALHPAVFSDMKEYGNRYCASRETSWHKKFGKYRGCSHPEELHALVKSTVMVRRLKAEVLPQLPPKRRQQVLLSLDATSMRPIQALMQKMKELKARMTREKENLELANEERTLMSKMYMETASAKIMAVGEYLETLLEGDCKFLVFAHHQVLLDGIEAKVKELVKYIRIDGKTPHETRPGLVESFQQDVDVRVALLSIMTTGVGITLTAASAVVFAEMAWTPGVLAQAEDRAHRIGQVNSLNVIYLHAPETIDDIIWETVGRKLENIGQVMDGKDCSLELDDANPPSKLSRKRTVQECLTSHALPKQQDDGLVMDKYHSDLVVSGDGSQPSGDTALDSKNDSSPSSKKQLQQRTLQQCLVRQTHSQEKGTFEEGTAGSMPVSNELGLGDEENVSSGCVPESRLPEGSSEVALPFEATTVVKRRKRM